MISFNVPPYIGNELEYVKDAVDSKKICGDGKYTKMCSQWLERRFNSPKALITTSCTHSLEMAAILCDIKEGDEVIMPSFTFVSTAGAFVLRGAKIVFVDIRPDTMNIDENLIDKAITDKTRAIVPVHYGGVSCEMEEILKIAQKYNLFIIEDAAQAVMSTYRGKALGTLGHFGCFSFHETKNYSMGEGGAILIQKEEYIERAEIVREKGTNRNNFLRGEIDKYTWVDIGSSYLASELNAAYLYAQLEQADLINSNRIKLWNNYYEGLKELEVERYIDLPFVPDGLKHNAHMFYIKVKDLVERNRLIKYLKENEVSAAFHYIPLHTSPAGQIYGRFNGKDVYTSKESERLLRLPMHYGLGATQIQYVIDLIKKFYMKKGH